MISWERAVDEENYKRVIQAIQDRNASVFIGAGLSKNANYPDWYTLIKILSNEAGISQLNNDVDYYEQAEECRELLGEDTYQEIIINAYTAGDEKKLTTFAYLNLLHSPFQSFITTNFDPCLVNADRQNGTRKKLFLPDRLMVDHARGGHMFHIHGLIHPDNPTEYFPSVILTSEDYRSAYETEDEIPNFLLNVFDQQSIIFIGFSLNDRILLDILERKEERRKHRARGMVEKGYKLKNMPDYAFLPISELSLQNLLQGELAVEEYIDSLILKDSRYSKYGVTVIRFIPQSKTFVGLENLIEDIRTRTSSTPILPYPVPEGFTLEEDLEMGRQI